MGRQGNHEAPRAKEKRSEGGVSIATTGNRHPGPFHRGPAVHVPQEPGLTPRPPASHAPALNSSPAASPSPRRFASPLEGPVFLPFRVTTEPFCFFGAGSVLMDEAPTQ